MNVFGNIWRRVRLSRTAMTSGGFIFLIVIVALLGPALSPHDYLQTDFGQLLRSFPDSRYAPDARQRMVYLRNQMAEQDTAGGQGQAFKEREGAQAGSLCRAGSRSV